MTYFLNYVFINFSIAYGFVVLLEHIFVFTIIFKCSQFDHLNLSHSTVTINNLFKRITFFQQIWKEHYLNTVLRFERILFHYFSLQTYLLDMYASVSQCAGNVIKDSCILLNNKIGLNCKCELFLIVMCFSFLFINTIFAFDATNKKNMYIMFWGLKQLFASRTFDIIT